MLHFSVSQFPFEAKIIIKLCTSAAPTIININEENYVNPWKQIPKFFTQEMIAYYSYKNTPKWHWLYAPTIVMLWDASNRKVSGLVNPGYLLIHVTEGPEG